MPDKRRHRGPHPADEQLFAESAWGRLREAVADLSWLLTRGYAPKSALKLVGDRCDLTERQRIAVMRCACSDASLARRQSHHVGGGDLADGTLALDGYNVLTTMEAALAGGVVLVGRDRCYRDMAGMDGTYRKVRETAPAIALLGELLATLGIQRATWYLDSPVSNSGRLKTRILQLAAEQKWDWDVELVPNPDTVLCRTDRIVVTADSVVLDRCGRWYNLACQAVRTHAPAARVVDLSVSTN